MPDFGLVTSSGFHIRRWQHIWGLSFVVFWHVLWYRAKQLLWIVTVFLPLQPFLPGRQHSAPLA